MTHVIVPFLVVGVLHRFTAAKVINRCFVCFSVEDVDIPKPSAHFDRAVSSAAISALSSVAGSLWTRVGADTLGTILQASIIKVSGGAVGNTPIRRVVPEIVVGSLKEHPVEIVEGVLEASDVSELGRVVGGVLVEVHSPGPSATVASISRATHVTVAAVSLCSGGLIGADTALPILKSGICKSCSIACSDALFRSVG